MLNPQSLSEKQVLLSTNFFLGEDDPSRVCQEIDSTGSEIFHPNDFYGQAAVIKYYSGTSRVKSLKCILEHGISLDDWIWECELNSNLPLHFPATARRASLYKAKSGKAAIPIGFGFLYAVHDFHKRFEDVATNVKPAGTIVFPSHSTSHIAARFDSDAYANELARLPEKYKPIYVCMYWKDYLEGRHLDYVDKGFTIVSAGHMLDQLFLYRLYNICRHFKYATSNDIGTHLFAAVKSGSSFFYTGLDIAITHENPNNVPFELTDVYHDLNNKSRKLFANKLDASTCEQMQFVDSHI